MAVLFIKKIIAGLTAPCRDVTASISRDADGELPLIARYKIRVHFLICDGCRRYGTQIGLMKRLFQRYGERAEGEMRLSEEAKERMKEALRSTRA